MNKTQADARRKQIIREAAALFNVMGYHNASMDAIAEAVGLRKPTLYHYVQSKEEILYWIHDEFLDELTHRHQARLHTRMTNSELLFEVLADIIEMIADYPGFSRAFFEHERELNSEMQAAIGKKRDAYFFMIVDVIRRGVERGEFQTEHPTLTALALFGMGNWAYQWLRADGPMRPREIAYHFWDIFQRGLGSASVRHEWQKDLASEATSGGSTEPILLRGKTQGNGDQTVERN